MRKLLLFLLFAACTGQFFAATPPALVHDYSAPRSFATPTLLYSVPALHLPAGHHLQQRYVHTDRQGRRHVKYDQYAGERRVLNGTVVLHLENDKLYRATGRIVWPATSANKFVVSAAQATQLARLRVSNDPTFGLANPPTAGTVTEALAPATYPVAGGPGVPVYVVNLTAPGQPHALPVDVDVVVNARTGRILAQLSNVHSEAAEGTGDGFYNQGYVFPTQQIGDDRFELTDVSRGAGVYAYDITRNYTVPHDEDNVWQSDRENEQAMLDGYVGSVRFYDFLEEYLDRNSLDDNGVALIANMNQHNYVNAFWNGESANFGNGNCDQYSPLTTWEIVAHEYAHGLTDYTSDLIYYKESGALNESISDIMGKAFEWYYDTDNFNWKIGKLIRRDNSVRWFRSMDNPNERFHPSYYLGIDWYEGEGDAGGVHFNSGVLNHWFYLLVEGKKFINEVGYSYDVASIGMDQALQLVYLMEAAYLTEDSNYPDAYEYSLSAAADLFGTESDTYASVVEAWRAVGLPQEDTGPTDEPVTLAGSASGYPRGGDPGSFYVCPDRTNDLVLSVANESDRTLPAGTQVFGQTVFEYSDLFGEVFIDTFAIDTVLAADLPPFGDFDVELTDQEAPQDVSFIFTTTTLFLVDTAATAYVLSSTGFVVIDLLTEPRLFTVEVGTLNACSEIARIQEDFAVVELPVCVSTSAGVVRWELTGENGVVWTDDTYVFPELSLSRYAVAFNRLLFANLSELGDIRRVNYRLLYVDDAGETELTSGSFANSFATTLDQPTLLTFDTPQGAFDTLMLTACDNCDVDADQQALQFFGNQFVGQAPTCIPADEYILTEAFAVSTVAMCVDLTEMEDPFLVFDLEQEDNPAYSELENDYLHSLIVTDDAGNPLTREPITSTGGEMRSFEVKLPEAYVGMVEIQVLSNQTTTRLDNLGLVEGSPTGTPYVADAAWSVNYPNPVDDRLLITVSDELPRGSRLALFDAAGRQVLSRDVAGRRVGLDVATLPAGLYVLTLTDGAGGRYTGKVVKR